MNNSKSDIKVVGRMSEQDAGKMALISAWGSVIRDSSRTVLRLIALIAAIHTSPEWLRFIGILLGK